MRSSKLGGNKIIFIFYFCHNHSLTKPNICAKFERNRRRDLSCMTPCLVLPGFHMDTLLINSFNYIQIAEICVLAMVRKGKAKLKTKLRAVSQIHQFTSLSVFQRRLQTCKCTLLFDYRTVHRPWCLWPFWLIFVQGLNSFSSTVLLTFWGPIEDTLDFSPRLN